jgi:hypothetical protein
MLFSLDLYSTKMVPESRRTNSSNTGNKKTSMFPQTFSNQVNTFLLFTRRQNLSFKTDIFLQVWVGVPIQPGVRQRSAVVVASLAVIVSLVAVAGSAARRYVSQTAMRAIMRPRMRRMAVAHSAMRTAL